VVIPRYQGTEESAASSATWEDGKPNGADTAKWRCGRAPIPKLGKIQLQMPSEAQRTQHYWQVETAAVQVAQGGVAGRAL